MADLNDAFNVLMDPSKSGQQMHNYFNMQYQNNGGYQQAEWIQPKKKTISITPEHARELIADQHRFHPSELKFNPDDKQNTHWCFIRIKTGDEYCYPKMDII